MKSENTSTNKPTGSGMAPMSLFEMFELVL